MSSPEQSFEFEDLTPGEILDTVETALGRPMTGLTHPQPSYINRVYELQTEDGERLIAKFYRPGRWTREALLDEHTFMQDCVEAEIPVVPPIVLKDGETLGQWRDTAFAVFPKRWGRGFEIIDDEDWQRLGRVLGRLHLVGARREADARVILHPAESTLTDVEYLLEHSLVTESQEAQFCEVTHELLEVIIPMFDNVPLIRIHGDLHAANILMGADMNIMLIDFDDMSTGPMVHDLWMLLPGNAADAKHQIELIIEGYEDFMEFDDRQLRLIEPLRAMRKLYFLAWCSRQINDPAYQRNFPDWGTESFWQKEINGMYLQLEAIRGKGVSPTF